MAASREGANSAVQGGRKHADLTQGHLSPSTVRSSEPKPRDAAQATFDGVDGGNLWPRCAQPCDLDAGRTNANGDAATTGGEFSFGQHIQSGAGTKPRQRYAQYQGVQDNEDCPLQILPA